MADPLVVVEALAAALAAPDPPTVLDVRWRLTGPSARDLYEAGHIPGAHFVDLDDELAGPPGEGGRHPLPDPDAFQASMRRGGVSRGRAVVAYDAGTGTSAARAWWLLRWAGHRDVRVLDGGLAAWEAEGHPLSTEPPPPQDGDFVVSPGAMPVLDAASAAQLARDGTLVDARAPERFRGEVEPIDPVAGHIPGARNAPAGANSGSDGRMLDADALRERFASLGPAPYGAYCGSGVAAAQAILALERAGLDGALYVGSWSNWITDPERPVEHGG